MTSKPKNPTTKAAPGKKAGAAKPKRDKTRTKTSTTKGLMENSALTKLDRAVIEAIVANPGKNHAECYRLGGGTAKEPYTAVYKILNKVEGRKYHQTLLDQLSEKAVIEAHEVLAFWAKQVRADPSSITRLRRSACRFCYGVDHNYQWRDQNEWDEACDRIKETAKYHKAKEDKGENIADALLPSCIGGFGYNHTLQPHPHCPRCSGEGHETAYFEDTRNISEQDRILFNGVEITRSGSIKINIKDQNKAAENIARTLGMYQDNFNLGGKTGDALTELLNAVRGNVMKPKDQD